MQAALLWGRHIGPAFRWGISYFSSLVLHCARPLSILPQGLATRWDSRFTRGLRSGSSTSLRGHRFCACLTPCCCPSGLHHPRWLLSPPPLPPCPLPIFGILAFQGSQSTPVKSHPGKSGFLPEDRDINKRGPPKRREMLWKISLIISVILFITLLHLTLLKEYSSHNVGRGRLLGGPSQGWRGVCPGTTS